MTRDVERRVTCPTCKHFLGIVTSDGKGPLFDGCPEEQEKCPMVSALACYQPAIRRPCDYRAGKGKPKPVDEDSGGYGAIARRCLEDG